MSTRLHITGRLKEGEQQERRENKVTALIETVKKLVLTMAEIDSLKNDKLNLQLDCHRAEIEKRSSVVGGIPGKDSENTAEKVSLKRPHEGEAQSDLRAEEGCS